MQDQIVCQDLLEKSKKILFLTHLAIGDFTYLQNYFREFSRNYPHLKIDLWVDEGRGKSFLRRWDLVESKYILYDWLSACSYINRVYKNVGSWWRLIDFFGEIRNEKYDIIVSLAACQPHRYAYYAKKMQNSSFLVGAKNATKKYQFVSNYYFEKLDGCVDFRLLNVGKNFHITDFYASWFEKIFGLKVLPKYTTKIWKTLF